MSNYIDILLKDKKICEDIDSQEFTYLFSQLNIENESLFEGVDVVKLFRIISVLLPYTLSDSFQEKDKAENMIFLSKTYRLLKSIDIDNVANKQVFDQILGIEGVETRILVLLFILHL